MQQARVLLLLLVAPWHGESFLPSAQPGHTPDRGIQRDARQAATMCGFSASNQRASTVMGAAGDDPDAAAATSGGRASTWSNPGGKDLVQVSDDVWAAERPFVWNSIDVGE